MPVFARPLMVWCAAAMLAAGCTHTVGGTALRAAPEIHEDSRSPIDVETVMLDQAQMRAITGAGEALTVVPTMDGKVPVDIEPLMESTPPQCQWLFAESQTFGPDVEEFHKTTFQNPPHGGLISEGAAAYRDADTARRAFDDLVGLVDGCWSSPYGFTLVGDWTAASDSLQTRPGGCGRDYRLKSVVLVEVSYCAFPESVPDIVLTNILDNVPG
jgi:hypothetical protein